MPQTPIAPRTPSAAPSSASSTPQMNKLERHIYEAFMDLHSYSHVHLASIRTAYKRVMAEENEPLRHGWQQTLHKRLKEMAESDKLEKEEKLRFSVTPSGKATIAKLRTSTPRSGVASTSTSSSPGRNKRPRTSTAPSTPLSSRSKRPRTSTIQYETPNTPQVKTTSSRVSKSEVIPDRRKSGGLSVMRTARIPVTPRRSVKKAADIEAQLERLREEHLRELQEKDAEIQQLAERIDSLSQVKSAARTVSEAGSSIVPEAGPSYSVPATPTPLLQDRFRTPKRARVIVEDSQEFVEEVTREYIEVSQEYFDPGFDDNDDDGFDEDQFEAVPPSQGSTVSINFNVRESAAEFDMAEPSSSGITAVDRTPGGLERDISPFPRADSETELSEKAAVSSMNNNQLLEEIHTMTSKTDLIEFEKEIAELQSRIKILETQIQLFIDQEQASDFDSALLSIQRKNQINSEFSAQIQQLEVEITSLRAQHSRDELQAQKSLAEVRAELERVTEQFVASKSELKDLQTQLSTATSENSSLNILLQDAQNELDIVVNKMKSLQTELTSVTEKNIALAVQIELGNAKIAELTNIENMLRDEIRKCTAEAEKYAMDKAELIKNTDSVISERNAEIAKLKSEEEELKAKLAEVTEILEAERVKAVGLQVQLDDAVEANAQAEREHTVKVSELEKEWNIEREELNRLVAGLCSEIKVLEAKLKEEIDARNEVQQATEKLQLDIEAKASEIELLKEDLNTVNNEVVLAEKKNAEIQMSIEALRSEKEELEAQCNMMEQEKTMVMRRQEELKAQMQEIKSQRDRNIEELNQILASERRHSEKVVTDLEMKISQKDADLEKIKTLLQKQTEIQNEMHDTLQARTDAIAAAAKAHAEEMLRMFLSKMEADVTVLRQKDPEIDEKKIALDREIASLTPAPESKPRESSFTQLDEIDSQVSIQLGDDSDFSQQSRGLIDEVMLV